ncbi:MAG: (Fe-S)-binding protein [Negativicutes bacterium]
MNKSQEKLNAARELVSQCDRCGTCLTVCPLFGSKDIESSSARGKNSILRALAEGGIEPNPEVRAALDFCILCQRCVDNCPAKVKTDEAMILARQYLADNAGGATLKYQFVGGAMSRPWLIKMGALGLSVARKLGLNSLAPFGAAPDEYTRTHYLTAFSGPGALGSATAPSSAAVTPNSRVAYFKGCGMQILFPEAAAQSMEVLGRITKPVTRDNVCCGLPHLAHAMGPDFLELARENIRQFEDVDVVVSDCASCSGTLKHVGSYLADDSKWKERAAAFSAKIMDLTEYLAKSGYVPRQKSGAKITYHDPCHLCRGQGIKKEPRALLAAAGDYREMKDSDVCCGGGGSFFMDYPEISDSIIDKKRRNIEATGADVVVTGCPGCLIQLNKAAKASGKFKALHISQVV